MADSTPAGQGENLLCFGDNANFLRGSDRPHPRCLRVPQRVLGETFKEGPKHKDKDPMQFDQGHKT